MKAFIFPGQGSQKVGMGADIFDNFNEHVEAASDLMGYCLKTLCLEDPKGELGQTQFTQPALYVVSALMYLDEIEKAGIKPDVVAGHSLGEYNALFAAGAFTFIDGLKLVKKRAELMSKSNGGSMAAIVGSSSAELKELLVQENFKGLDIASVNSSKQIVVSGASDLISKAATYFESLDAQYYPLNVSAAFHSRHMKPAADEFFECLRSIRFSPLQIPVISNVFARPYDEAQTAKILASQIHSSVRWEESMQYMMAMGVNDFLEVGPGSVLTNMQKNIAADPHLMLSDSDIKTMPEQYVSGSSDDRLEAVKEKRLESKNVLEKEFKLVLNWNDNYPIGSKIKLQKTGDIFRTRSKAMLLFGRKAAIYLDDKKGFFALSEIYPLN